MIFLLVLFFVTYLVHDICEGDSDRVTISNNNDVKQVLDEGNVTTSSDNTVIVNGKVVYQERNGSVITNE